MQLPKLLFASLVFLAACTRPDTAEPVPAPASTNQSDALTEAPSCIQQKITAILAEPVRNPPARVLRFTYNSDTVFYFPAYCCDHYSELYDSDCNLICHPDGGITGRGDGLCPTFWSTATDSVEIWRDNR
jgi:hypothetical protein